MPLRADGIWLLDHGEILGGGQRFGLRLAESMRDAGYEVTVTTRRFPAPVPWNPAVIPELVRMRRFLAGVGPEAIVIGNHPRAHAFLLAASPRAGGPAIVNVAHERESAARWAARFAYGRSGALVAVGSNAAAEYRRRLPGTTVTKVNNFLPLGYFERAERRRPDAPRSAPISLGVLARLIPEKGVAELVDELAAPAATGTWREALIGGGAQDARYAARVRELIAAHGLGDRIRLLGDVTDVPGFLASVDALVVPSTGHEAQPTVILEALAHGVPVAVREGVFSPDFEGLPVVPYRDGAALAAALPRLPPTPAPAAELARRFGPAQAIAGIEAAAQLARARS